MSESTLRKPLTPEPVIISGESPLHAGRILLYGFILWAVVFSVSIGLHAWRVTQQPLFDSAIPVVLALATTLLMTAYLLSVESNFLRHGVATGITWLLVCVLLDALLLLPSPIRISVDEYIEEVALTYSMIPILTLGLAYQRLERSATPRRAQRAPGDAAEAEG